MSRSKARRQFDTFHRGLETNLAAYRYPARGERTENLWNTLFDRLRNLRIFVANSENCENPQKRTSM
jgi:hypothetical protein